MQIRLERSEIQEAIDLYISGQFAGPVDVSEVTITQGGPITVDVEFITYSEINIPEGPEVTE